MAKITFVYPDFESAGVEYLMAVCLKKGHEVNFVFYNAEDKYIGEKSKHVSYLDIAKKIANTIPDFVAFSCVTDNYRYQLNCAKAVKEIMPEVIIVFGGIHPTAVPETVLKEAVVDCVAIGEAEESFPDFLKECNIDNKHILPRKPIKGIIYKVEDKLIGDLCEGELPDLNLLPFPHKKPFYSSSKMLSYCYHIMTSRGCPYSCSYCLNSYLCKLRGKSIFRQRSVDNVIAEILQAKCDYSLKYINFLDDCFTTHDEWILEFCQRYKEEINIPFACITIPQYLNKEKIEALNSAGCYHIQIGVQCLDKHLCDTVLQRRSDNAKTAEVINMLRHAGIVVQVDHMFGIPGDTLEIERDSALFYNQCRPNVISVFWLIYYPRTKIIEIAKSKNILNDRDIENINEGFPLRASEHNGGSMVDPKPYWGIRLLFHYLPLLPRWLVRFLIKNRLYNIFSIRNFFIAVAFPRFILAVLTRKNFCDREYMVRFINKVFSHG